MDTQQLERLLPSSSATSSFSVVPLDEMIHRLYSWKMSRLRSGRAVWQFLIFNCCDVTQPGRHWMVLILPPSRVDSLILFDSLSQTYPALMKVFRLLNLENIWRNTRRVQAWSSSTCGLHCLYFVYRFLKRCELYNSSEQIARAVMIHDYRCRRPNMCDAMVTAFVSKMN